MGLRSSSVATCDRPREPGGGVMARRSFGTGSIAVRRDRKGRETRYGLWMAGGRRVKRQLGAKRAPGTSDGLTRRQGRGGAAPPHGR